VTANDFLRLPVGVMTLFVVMLWPAIWAGALLIVALAGDLIRQANKRRPPAWRNAA
jgi:hypothetical protein